MSYFQNDWSTQFLLLPLLMPSLQKMYIVEEPLSFFLALVQDQIHRNNSFPPTTSSLFVLIRWNTFALSLKRKEETNNNICKHSFQLEMTNIIIIRTDIFSSFCQLCKSVLLARKRTPKVVLQTTRVSLLHLLHITQAFCLLFSLRFYDLITKVSL